VKCLRDEKDRFGVDRKLLSDMEKLFLAPKMTGKE